MVKFYLLKIEIRDGERSYTEVRLLEDSSNKKSDEIADAELSTYYYTEEGEEPERYNEWYEGDGGEVMARVGSIVEISKADYEVLSRFF